MDLQTTVIKIVDITVDNPKESFNFLRFLLENVGGSDRVTVIVNGTVMPLPPSTALVETPELESNANEQQKVGAEVLEEEPSQVCAICYVETPDCKLPCQHHRECLMPWLVENLDCSFCRAPYGAVHIVDLLT